MKKSYRVVGVMSGTSLDGVDLAYCTFTKGKSWEFTIHKATTVKYTAFWVTKLASSINLSLSEIEALDEAYTIYLAEIISNFINENDIQGIDAVCSHGHTVLHQPHLGITKQIGNKAILASLINEKLVCDFRVQDVALGGQGAPLVPIGDQLLFSDYDYCLNLGGFSNLSTEVGTERIAFDVCPVNIVLNHYAKQLGYDYDAGGAIAESGTLHEELFKQLNVLDYYIKPFPKSLGLEWVKENIFPLIDSYAISIEDKLATFTLHIANQLTRNIRKNSKVLVTGGGAYNTFLINILKVKSNIQFYVPSPELVEFKEALIFAFLGVLKLRNEVNCLQSVTGASQNHSTGVIFLP